MYFILKFIIIGIILIYKAIFSVYYTLTRLSRTCPALIPHFTTTLGPSRILI